MYINIIIEYGHCREKKCLQGLRSDFISLLYLDLYVLGDDALIS